MTVALCGIKFFYEKTLGRDWTPMTFVRPGKSKKLPVVLSRQEVKRVLDCVRLVQYRAVLTLIPLRQQRFTRTWLKKETGRPWKESMIWWKTFDWSAPGWWYAGNRRHIPWIWPGIHEPVRRPNAGFTQKGHTRHHWLPHWNAGRSCLRVRRLRTTSIQLSFLPEPPLPEMHEWPGWKMAWKTKRKPPANRIFSDYFYPARTITTSEPVKSEVDLHDPVSLFSTSITKTCFRPPICRRKDRIYKRSSHLAKRHAISSACSLYRAGRRVWHWTKSMETGPWEVFCSGQSIIRHIPGQSQGWTQKNEPFSEISQSVWEKDWVVHSKPVGDGNHVLEYVAPYVYRVAISNNRIVSINDDQVTFRYRDSGTSQWKTTTIPSMEFIRRFLQHVLPKGFIKVRRYGFLSPIPQKTFAKIRTHLSWLLILLINPLLTGKKDNEIQAVEEHEIKKCRFCGGKLILTDTINPGERGPPHGAFYLVN